MSSEVDRSLPPFNPAVLADYPPEIGAAANAFATSRARSDLRTALHGLLRFHQVKSADAPAPLDPATAPRDTALLGGLSLDSLAMAELAFLLEDLWGIQLQNEELLALVTLGDLEDLLFTRLNAND